MSEDRQVHELEAGLRARARELVLEHVAKGEAERQRVLGETARRLRLREERETLAAKAEAERLYRQRVQAAELRLQGDLDRLRWTLMREVMEAVRGRLADLADNEERYLPLLAAWLGAACERIGESDLVAELNARDHERLAGRWEAFARPVTARRVTLGPALLPVSGGVLVRNRGNTVRVDSTFEGRIDRLAGEAQRAILERLFAAVPDMDALING